MLTVWIFIVFSSMVDLSGSLLIIIFSITIVVSYLFNILAKKSGIPSVLMLIFLGILINSSLTIAGVGGYDFKSPGSSILEVLGVFGLILIVLEAALDLRLAKDRVSVILKSFLVALIALAGTSYLGALVICFFIESFSVSIALLYTIPLSILSSAILLPSVGSLSEKKKEFLVYESTFSDIIGIIGFTVVLNVVDGSGENAGIYGQSFSSLVLTVVFSILISYALIYVFQNIRGKTKLFLLIAVLVLLYELAHMLNLTSLLIILIFGIILNNHGLFFKGRLAGFVSAKKIDSILDDFKVITAESAFVVRTFFFIIFGWSVSLLSLVYNKDSGVWTFKIFLIGLVLLLAIYLVRFLVLVLFTGKRIMPQLFLAPRGLITILLFYAIPQNLTPKTSVDFEGVLLFIILSSCLVMSWALMRHKKPSSASDSDVLDSLGEGGGNIENEAEIEEIEKDEGSLKEDSSLDAAIDEEG